MVIGESSPSHQGRGNRGLRGLGQPEQLGRRSGGDDSSACVDHRSLCGHEQIDGRADLQRVALHVGFVAREVDLSGGVVPFDVGVENVLWEIDQNGTRAAGACQMKGLVNHVRDLGRIRHEVVVLRRRHADSPGVGFLEGVVADGVGGHLTGDGDDRH